MHQGGGRGQGTPPGGQGPSPSRDSQTPGWHTRRRVETQTPGPWLHKGGEAQTQSLDPVQDEASPSRCPGRSCLHPGGTALSPAMGIPEANLLGLLGAGLYLKPKTDPGAETRVRFGAPPPASPPPARTLRPGAAAGHPEDEPWAGRIARPRAGATDLGSRPEPRPVPRPARPAPPPLTHFGLHQFCRHLGHQRPPRREPPAVASRDRPPLVGGAAARAN